MPRPSGLTLALAAVLAAPFGAQAAVDCTPTLQVTGEGTDLQVSLSTPCVPYLPVDILYGPLHIREETSRFGRLDVELPRVRGATRIAVLSEATNLVAELDDGPVAEFTAIDWGDAQPWGQLGGSTIARLGFRPTDGAPHVDIVRGQAASQLTVDVTDENCGEVVSASIIRQGMTQPGTMQLRIPDCARAGTLLEIPLIAE